MANKLSVHAVNELRCLIVDMLERDGITGIFCSIKIGNTRVSYSNGDLTGMASDLRGEKKKKKP